MERKNKEKYIKFGGGYARPSRCSRVQAVQHERFGPCSRRVIGRAAGGIDRAMRGTYTVGGTEAVQYESELLTRIFFLSRQVKQVVDISAAASHGPRADR